MTTKANVLGALDVERAGRTLSMEEKIPIVLLGQRKDSLGWFLCDETVFCQIVRMDSKNDRG